MFCRALSPATTEGIITAREPDPHAIILATHPGAYRSEPAAASTSLMPL
jgi:hypothetical protein